MLCTPSSRTRAFLSAPRPETRRGRFHTFADAHARVAKAPVGIEPTGTGNQGRLARMDRRNVSRVDDHLAGPAARIDRIGAATPAARIDRNGAATHDGCVSKARSREPSFSTDWLQSIISAWQQSIISRVSSHRTGHADVKPRQHRIGRHVHLPAVPSASSTISVGNARGEASSKHQDPASRALGNRTVRQGDNSSGDSAHT